MMRKNIAAILVSLFAMVVVGAPTDARASLEEQCRNERLKAVGTYMRCMMKRGDTRRRARCVHRLVRTATKLHTYSATTCAEPRWQDNLDGTVTDHLTGLVWEQKTNLDGVPNAADPHDADNQYNLTTEDDADLTDDDGTAFTEFLAALNAGGGFAGSAGWRLPTIEELNTLYIAADCASSGPCTDSALGAVVLEVPEFGVPWYWSSTSHYPEGVGGALAQPSPVNGGGGSSRSSFNYVRAVRRAVAY